MFGICKDVMATDVMLCEQAMLVLQAGSVADARARMARIQPFWKTLSAQSRMDLLSIPVAAAKQRVAELAAKRQAAQLTPVQHAAKQGTKHGSAFKQGAHNLLQLPCRTCERFSPALQSPPVC